MFNIENGARAAVAVAPLVTELQTFPIRDVSEDDAWLKVEASGVCGTDWEFYERRKRGSNLGPIILGHEIVGRIAAIGDKAAKKWNLQVGTRVAIEEFIPCGVCSLCRGGNYRLCAQTESRGAAPFLRYRAVSTQVTPRLWGGFCEWLYVHPDSVLYQLPESIPAEKATLFIPISNGIRWVTQEATPVLGGTIVIMGPGQLGLGCVIAAKESGFKNIVVTGLSRDVHRFDIDKKLGATEIVEVDRAISVDTDLEITEGEGVDVVPNLPDTLIDSVKMLKKFGETIIAATKVGQGDLSLMGNGLLKKSATLRGVRGHDRSSVAPALSLMESGRYQLDLLLHSKMSIKLSGPRTAATRERSTWWWSQKHEISIADWALGKQHALCFLYLGCTGTHLSLRWCTRSHVVNWD